MHGSGNTARATGCQVHVNQAAPVSGSKPGIVVVAGCALTVGAAYANGKTRTEISGSSTGVDLVHGKL
jgi:hypothetical protein